MGGPSCTAAAFPLRETDNNNNHNHQDGIAMTIYPSAYVSSSTSATQPPTVTGTPEYGGGTATSVDDGGVPMHLQPKLGGTCCGFCCDFRRATIIVNSVIIGLSTFSLVSLFNRPDAAEIMRGYEDIDVDDDVVLNDLAEIADDSFLASAILGGVLVVFTAVPLYGAYMFDARMVSFGVVLLVATLVTEILVAYFYIEKADKVVEPTELYEFNQPIVIYTLTAIIQALFIYPHVGLILEIRSGIMSFETYSREAYSCCCGVPRPPPQPQVPPQATNYYPSSPTTTTTMNGQPNYTA